MSLLVLVAYGLNDPNKTKTTEVCQFRNQKVENSVEMGNREQARECRNRWDLVSVLCTYRTSFLKKIPSVGF